MSISPLLRASTVVVLCLLLAFPTFPQGLCCSGGIGPSKGQVIAVVVVAAVVLTGVGFLIYHETHKHPSITGCVASGADGLTLQNEKDKKAYMLSRDSIALKAGERVTVRGKKRKGSDGKTSFQVEKLTKDFGACAP